MIAERQIEIAHALLATKLVGKVYHSCELVLDEQRGSAGPCIAVGTEYRYVGADDTQGMYAYIRANGDATSTLLKVTSGHRAYQLYVPLRVVVFAQSDPRDRSELLNGLLGFTFLEHVTLLKVMDDKFALKRTESDQYRTTFDAATFYAAFDILVTSVLLPSTCSLAPCKVFPNPIVPS